MKNAISLFIARVSSTSNSEATKAWLLNSLDPESATFSLLSLDGTVSRPTKAPYQRLFYRAIELNVAVRLRIYVDDVNNSREEKFYDVDPNEACAIMAGDLDAEDEAFASFASSRLFPEKFDITHSAKVIQAIGKQLVSRP